jgi:hypothetical protein
MGVWIDTGLTTPGDILTNNVEVIAATVCTGDIFFVTREGRLYRSVGGTTAFTEVAAPFTATLVAMMHLYTYNNQVYSVEMRPTLNPTRTVRLLRWNGVNAWDNVAELNTSLSTSPSGEIFEFEGSLWASGMRSLQRWTGSGWSASSAHPVATDTVGPVYPHSDGFLYVGTTSGTLPGRLYRFRSSTGWSSALATQLNSQTRINPIFFDGSIMASTTGNPQIFRWNGSNAWTSAAPNVGTGNTEWPNAVILLNGKLFVVVSNGASTAAGRLYSYSPGASALVLEAPKLASWSDPRALFVFNNRLYAAATNINGDHSSVLLRWKGTPEESSVLPDSTAKVSHARLLRHYRNDTEAQEFHDLMQAAT